MDFLFHKVFNLWIVLGILCGIINASWKGGAESLLWSLINMAIPVIVLYPLFMMGCLGAGDLKLFAVIGSFFSIKEILICMVMAFVFGSVLSLGKMILERNFIERIQYFFSYVIDVFRSKKWRLYEEQTEKTEETCSYRHKIHFTLPILISVLFCKGGFFL